MRGRATILLLFALGCGGAEPAPAPVPKPKAVEVPGATMITPSALVPVLDDQVEPWFSEPGLEQHLVGGLRIVVHEGGRVERAAQRFSTGGVHAQPLPPRLGGGFLFYQADSQGTRLWRADTWTGPLRALTFIGPTATELRPGFDRLYLRTRTGQIIALDADSGAIAPLGTLPATSGFGAMVFADAWRGVVDTDIRGPLVTFDAGASWRPLPIDRAIANATVIEGDPVLYVEEGWYRLGPRGELQFLRYDEETRNDERADLAAAGPKPLGDSTLRAAIAHGQPLDATTAIVAYRGGLARVRLPEGVIEAHRPRVINDDAATCTGAKVGRGIGFVCGAEEGPTTIYRFVAPLGLEVVARFDAPRFVSPGHNGALVVRGPCDDDAPPAPKDTLIYCVIDPAGSRREIAVRGEVGAERVVALADGRAVVLVPPRLGRPGRVTIIAGNELRSHELVYPEEPARAVKIARRGLWLEGFQERKKGHVGGWIEAGGPVMGVSVEIATGKVTLGELRDEIDQALVSGPLGLVVTHHETALESVDGGMHWREMELPDLPSDDRGDRMRGCTAVGCVMRGWLRVGWGEPKVEHDLELAPTPESVMVKPELRDPLRLSCELISSPAEPKTPPGVGERAPFSGWHAFHGVAPPSLGKDELGVDKASQYTDETPSHVYVWGPKGADWTKAGHWQIRFDDRFRIDGVSSSALTRSPWGDEVAASDAIGARHGAGYWRWDAAMDPSGKAAIANLCMGTRCLPFAVADGEPIVQYKATTATPSYRRPLPHGVARVGESWYFLTEEPGGAELVLWRGRLGIMEPAAQLGRVDRRRYPVTSSVRLVRRALGGELGLLVSEPPDPSSGSAVGNWLVLPIEAERARLGEPIDLGPSDLGGKVPPRCTPQDDGWLLETAMPSAPVFHFVGATGYVDDVELRLRIEPGSACVEAIAARAGRSLAARDRASGGEGKGIPLAVREAYTGRRWSFSCTPR